MHMEAKRTWLRRLIGAGAICGALGLIGLDSVGAGERSGGDRFYKRWFRRSTVQAPVHSGSSQHGAGDIQLVQNEQPQFQADEKEVPFEEPAAAPQPAPFQADEKEHPPEEPGPEPWQLTNLFEDSSGYNPVKESGWKFSGHSQWGYSSEPDGAFTGNGPFLNQQEWGQFNLNQQYLYAEKIADGKDGLGWGARADIMYGVDGNEAQSFGNINPGHWDYLNGWDHGAYEWALPQVYGELAYKDWSVKLGHFYTIVGYEVVPSTGQFFFSRQLNFWNSEPFTHTGALASYKANDNLTVMAGWVAGWDTGFYQYSGGSSFIGGLTYKIDDKTAFVYSMTGGNLGWRGDGAVNSWILSRQWTKKFSTVHQFDVLSTNLDFAGTPASFGSAAGGFTPRNSTGLINYAFYDVTEKVKAGFRFEWYKADATSYYTMTGGFNIKPYDWLLIRPEVRGMWAPGNQQTYTGAHGWSGELFNQTLFGIDAIVIF